MGGGGRGIIDSLYDFFLGHSMNIFSVLTGVQEFFHLIFPCTNIFFCTSPVPHPPPPRFINFLMVRPLNELISFQLCGKLIHIITSPYLTDKRL